MNENDRKKMSQPVTKEERLAAKLRENLRRRKAQGREMRESNENRVPKTDPDV
ncbi:MAG: hypothetical protein AAF494_07195 [Pseudomonadota bacterium]